MKKFLFETAADRFPEAPLLIGPSFEDGTSIP